MREQLGKQWSMGAAGLLLWSMSAAVSAQAAPPPRSQAFAAVAALPDWDGTWSSVRGKDPEPVLTAKGAKLKADFEAGQARGDEGFINLGKVGEPQRTRDRVVAFRERIPAIEAAL